MNSPSSEIPVVEEKQITILGWPTDTVAIDFVDYNNSPQQRKSDSEQPVRKVPHTVLVFIPGNPGQYDWYVSSLFDLVTKLGVGYAVRSISHAGHGLKGGIVNVEEYAQKHVNADPCIPWTVNGQMLHKCAYMDILLSEFKSMESNDTDSQVIKPHSSSSISSPQFVFMGHSFGCFVIQRMCILRPDILERTKCFLYIMPFIRMKADWFNQTKLDIAAASHKALISIGTKFCQTFKSLPQSWMNRLIKSGIRADVARDIAIQLLTQPTFMKSFFELGTEEIRDIPDVVDVSAFNVLCKRCPIHMLYAGSDQWAPHFHMKDISDLQAKNILPLHIYMTYKPELRHDYVCYEEMSNKVVDWCHQCLLVDHRNGRNNEQNNNTNTLKLSLLPMGDESQIKSFDHIGTEIRIHSKL